MRNSGKCKLLPNRVHKIVFLWDEKLECREWETPNFTIGKSTEVDKTDSGIKIQLSVEIKIAECVGNVLCGIHAGNSGTTWRVSIFNPDCKESPFL